MRVVFVQYGAYAEAARRLSSGGPETFYAQRYSVEFVADLARRMVDVVVLHLGHDDPEERLPSGVRSVGIDLYPQGRPGRHLEMLQILSRLRPTHIVLVSPLPLVLAWALARGVRTLPLFADSFRERGLRARAKSALLALLLNNSRVDWVSNHNIAASMELVRIGVSPSKVLPFDWPAFLSPSERPAKELQTTGDVSVAYVGQIAESKGVGDLIDAVGALARAASGPRVRATIVGGHDPAFVARARALGIESRIEFLGRIAHDDIVPLMSRHDIVVVPSRHEYPEGLPMTIYEAFCSRTPIIASDHPMFSAKLRDRENAVIFRAGDVGELADRIRLLAEDAALYSRLSRNGEAAADTFFCPLKYHELIWRWLTNTAEDRQVLSAFSISSGRYAQPVS
jgi:glycosyltransferase involved in cell wall biosynthesis